MATAYYHRYTAAFKTGYMQKAAVKDIKVDADSGVTGTLATALKFKVGDLVTITSGTLVPVVATSSVSDAAITDATVTTSMYVIAQSDKSVEYGHIPVENRDYRYDNSVADSSTNKHVVLYQVIDVDDILVTNVAFTATTA